MKVFLLETIEVLGSVGDAWGPGRVGDCVLVSTDNGQLICFDLGLFPFAWHSSSPLCAGRTAHLSRADRQAEPCHRGEARRCCHYRESFFYRNRQLRASLWR